VFIFSKKKLFAYINLESEQNQFLNFIIIDQCYEKAKESTEKSKLLKKIVMKFLLLRKITRERRIKRDMSKIK
jgi:S-adenosylmethionine/arginine decarboxylase-like enzyme